MSDVNTVKYLKDYQQPDYWVTHVDLTFDIRDGETLVSAQITGEEEWLSSASACSGWRGTGIAGGGKLNGVAAHSRRDTG